MLTADVNLVLRLRMNGAVLLLPLLCLLGTEGDNFMFERSQITLISKSCLVDCIVALDIYGRFEYTCCSVVRV